MKTILGILLMTTFAMAEGERINCTARTYFNHSVSGGQCYFSDEVMTGIESENPLRVNCAKLQVDCYKSPVESPEKAIETDGNTR